MEFSVGFCSVERGEWSAENGNLAKCLRKFKVYFKFLWIFCFMKHGKWIVKTEFAWIFCFVLTLCVQNDKGVPSSCYKNAFYSSLRAVFAKNGVAIHEFKRKFTFGLPRICTLTLCKFLQ